MSDAGESARWVKKTSLYRRSLEVKAEIARHKWYESEKAGHDIGWERASVDWLVHHGLQDETSGEAST
jgi:hypothetical protein